MKDFDDYIRAGGDPVKLIEAARPLSASAAGGNGAGAEAQPGEDIKPLKTVKVEDIDVKAEPDWLVRGFFPAASCGLLAAEPKVGKTWLAANLTLSVASGTDFLGRKVVAPRPVLYVPAEDAIPSWGERIEGLALARGLERRGLPIHATETAAIRVDDARDLAALGKTVEKVGAGLVVLDPLAMLHGADENAAGEMLGVLQGLRALSRHTGAALLVVHHMRKPNGQGGRRAHRIRGSSALHGWADVLLFLEAIEKTGGLRLDVEARAFRSPAPIGLRFETAQGPDGRPRFWHGVEPLEEEDERTDYKARVIDALKAAGGRLPSCNEIAKRVGGKKEDVLHAIRELLAEGRLRKAGVGVELVPAAVPEPSPLGAGTGNQ